MLLSLTICASCTTVRPEVIVQREVAMDADETLRTAYAKLSHAIEGLFAEHWAEIRDGKCGSTPQAGPGSAHSGAAALGTLDTYKDEGLLTRGEELAPYWEDALHSLKGEPHVIDIRNVGLIGAIELSPIAGSPTKRAFSAFVKAFEKGALIRTTGDIIALSPPLIITKGQINELIDHVRDVLRAID